MKKFTGLCLTVLLIVPATGARGRAESATARELTGELTRMLRQFLVDAARNDRAGFETFFAEDVIYTRAVGVVIGKADILKSLKDEKPPTDTKTTYSAEDILVHEYADAAVVAFRLVANTAHNDGKSETENYRNTGTFLRRNGKWQVVAWQATKIAGSNENK
jgi:ketosteroid isomerase-like protein